MTAPSADEHTPLAAACDDCVDNDHIMCELVDEPLEDGGWWYCCCGQSIPAPAFHVPGGAR